MTKWELIEKLEQVTESASKAGLSTPDIINAMENVMRAIKRYFPKAAV